MKEFSTGIKCTYFPQCSGCEEQENPTCPPIWNDLKNFLHTQVPDLEILLIHKEILGWRMRSKLAVRGTTSFPEIGLFKRGSHEVIAIPDCPLHHPAINRAYQTVVDSIVEMRILPYQEKNHSGILRYFQFSVDKKSRRVQLVVVANQSMQSPMLEKWVKQLYTKGGFHSIWINFQPASTNTIFGNHWLLCEGEPYLEEKIDRVAFSFHPACFMQAHLTLFEQLIQSIRKNIIPNKQVVDLYAGVGVIGLNIAQECKQVICIEQNPFAAECFELSRLKLSPDIQKKSHFYSGDVEEFSSIICDAEIVIADPSRKGISAKVLEAINSSTKVQQLIYISCNPLSFKRDTLSLLNSGWKITKAEGYLLFPGTNTVETLCFFERNPLN